MWGLCRNGDEGLPQPFGRQKRRRTDAGQKHRVGQGVENVQVLTALRTEGQLWVKRRAGLLLLRFKLHKHCLDARAPGADDKLVLREKLLKRLHANHYRVVEFWGLPDFDRFKAILLPACLVNLLDFKHVVAAARGPELVERAAI